MTEAEPDDSLVTVSIACSDEAEARRIAGVLVERRLVACAQIWPIDSSYRWKGEIESAREFLLSAKTTMAALPALGALVLAEHSYEVPEIVAQPIAWTTTAYADWIRQNVRPADRSDP